MWLLDRYQFQPGAEGIDLAILWLWKDVAGWNRKHELLEIAGWVEPRGKGLGELQSRWTARPTQRSSQWDDQGGDALPESWVCAAGGAAKSHGRAPRFSNAKTWPRKRRATHRSGQTDPAAAAKYETIAKHSGWSTSFVKLRPEDVWKQLWHQSELHCSQSRSLPAGWRRSRRWPLPAEKKAIRRRVHQETERLIRG